MKNRPEIQLKFSWSDRILEIICGLLLFLQWFMVIYHFSLLPNIIPTHFNASGEADDFGSKNTIFILPVVATILYLFLTILNRYPHKFNYSAEITSDNVHAHYSLSTKMMRWIKVLIVLIFSILIFTTIQTGNEQEAQIGWWFLPFLIITNLLILMIYFIKASKIE